jgi:hypothetical protein
MKTVTLKLEDNEWTDLRIAAFKERQPFGAYLISRIRIAVAKPKPESKVRELNPETTSRVHPMDPQSVEQTLGKATEKAEPVSRKPLKGLDVPIMAVSNSAEDVKAQLKRLESANKEMRERGYGPKKGS